MKLQCKKGKKEKGNILLLCIVAIAILITFSSLITALVTGRSMFSRKVADLNDFMMLIEDANIQYQNEFLMLQAESVELVEYYFVNRLYEKQLVGAFTGPSRFHNEYLRGCIDPKFQKMIQMHYVEHIKPMEDPTDTINYDILSAEGEMSQMADFLYCYLIAHRMSERAPEVALQYSLPGKIEAKTTLLIASMAGSGQFEVSSHANGVRRELFTCASTVTVDENTLGTYYSLMTGAIADYSMVTKLTLPPSYLLGISAVQQETKFVLMPESFTATHNGFAYEIRPSVGDEKLSVVTWIIKGLQ